MKRLVIVAALMAASCEPSAKRAVADVAPVRMVIVDQGGGDIYDDFGRFQIWRDTKTGAEYLVVTTMRGVAVTQMAVGGR